MELERIDASLKAAIAIRDKVGRRYRVEALTEEVARESSDRLLRLHSLIPLVEPWTEADLLSNGTIDRAYTHKWTLSCIVRRDEDNEIVAVLIAFLRLAAKNHPLDAVYLHRLAVDPDHQRQGIGSALIDRFMSRTYQLMPWLRNITVQVTKDHPAGDVASFYESQGFIRLVDVQYPQKVDCLLVKSRADAPPNGPGLIAHPRLGSLDEGARVFISTTNPKKAGELRYLFNSYNLAVGIARKPIELTEPQVEGSNPLADIELVHHPLRLAARFLENRNSLPFLVEDTMLYIEFFNRDYDAVAELPGYDTKRWWKQLGARGVLDLMGATAKRRARYVSQVGAYTGKGRYIVGRGEVSGTISLSERVSDEAIAQAPMTSPWFFHTIFQPDGSERTLAEMATLEFAQYDYKRRAVEDFLPKLDFTGDAQLQLPYVDLD